ncbi:MAG TPA: prepilin-type N-terminal cleavage/methylation domain-containing protein [bacterium]|jgi:prepilin-type N-terminal cleavage/methylation domain-containing protein
MNSRPVPTGHGTLRLGRQYTWPVWNGARGFTLVELLIALALGALVLLVLFRAFTAAVAAEEDTQAQIAGHQQARATAQWIAGIVQGSAQVRAGTASAIELAGIYSPLGAVECRGVYAGRMGGLRGTVIYEQRRTPCPQGATSLGGPAVVVSDPTVSAVVAFGYLDDHGRAVEPKLARMVRITVNVDVNRDGRPEYALIQLAALRSVVQR